MKKGMMTLLVVAFAAFFAVLSVQSVFAGSETMAKDQPAASQSMQAETAQKVNINTADEGTLANLKGVGPKLAKRIIDYRSKNGKFKDIAELKNVKGIGDKLYAEIAPLITVE